MIEDRIILYVALIFAVFADCIHGFYYVGTAFFFFLLSVYIFLKDKYSFIKFVILWLSSWNLIKELFLDPLHFSVLELCFVASIIIARLFFKPNTY